MKRYILVILSFVFILAGCSNIETKADADEVSDILKKHLDVSPYIPKTDYEIGSVILEYYPSDGNDEDREPFYATVNFYDSTAKKKITDEKDKKIWNDNTPDKKLIYGDIYEDKSKISIEIYPDSHVNNINIMDSEEKNIAGHEVQYQTIKHNMDGESSETILMSINFNDISYIIEYNDQSNSIEDGIKEVAENIIKNNI